MPRQGTETEPWARKKDEYAPRPAYKQDAKGNWYTEETDEQAMEHYRRGHEWDQATLAAVSLGKLTHEQAYDLGSNEIARGDWHFGPRFKPLPQTLYHVTTHLTEVRQHGLKTRYELGMQSGHGLGGGTNMAVSFTEDLDTARQIYGAIIEAIWVLTGRLTVEQMLDMAYKGTGAKRPWIEHSIQWGGAYFISNKWQPEEPYPPHFQAFLDRKNIETGWGKTVEEMPSGSEPVGEGWQGGDGKQRYTAFRVPMTEKRYRDMMFDWFKVWLYAREEAGGPMNPLFFSTDIDALSKIPENEIAILQFEPVPGAMGTRESALGEWRTYTGKAVELVGKIEPEMKTAAGTFFISFEDFLAQMGGFAQLFRDDFHQDYPDEATCLKNLKRMYTKFVKEATKWQFPLTVYREVTLSNLADLNTDTVGSAWTVYPVEEGAFWSNPNATKGEPWILKAEVGPESIDWAYTLWNRMYYSGTGEAEVTLDKGAPVKIVAVRKAEDKGWTPFGKTVTAGVPISNLTYLHSPDPTDNPAFKAWFRNSVVKDFRGNPMPVYHGSTHQFESFSTKTSNPENHYGQGMYFIDSEADVTRNYAMPEGPDITNCIERRTDEFMGELEHELGEDFPVYSTTEYEQLKTDSSQKAIDELTGGTEGMVYLTYLRIEKPVYVSRNNQDSTWFEINYDERTGQETGSGMRLYKSVLKTGQQFGVDGHEVWEKLQANGDLVDSFTAYRFEQVFRGCEDLPEDIYIQSGNYIAQVYRNMGFDGIIQMEPSQQFGNMGIFSGTHHYIVWNPRQVKSAIGNRGTFSPRSPRMTAAEETGDIEEVRWTKPLYHGTSTHIARKIKKLQAFDSDDSGGHDEMGRGVYAHPSMNRTSPWARGMGAFLEIHFSKPLRLAVMNPRMPAQRELIDLGFDGVYDEHGLTQVPHQVLLFNNKDLQATGRRRLGSELVDWPEVRVIPFDEERHGYLRGWESPGEKQYYRGASLKAEKGGQPVNPLLRPRLGIAAALRKLPRFNEVHYIYYPDTDSYTVVGFLDGEGLFSETVPMQRLRNRYGDRLAERMIRYEGEPISTPGVTGELGRFKRLYVHDTELSKADRGFLGEMHITGNKDKGVFASKTASGRVTRDNAVWKGRRFTLGAASLLDGQIEEVHNYRECVDAGWHHTAIFSEAVILKEREDFDWTGHPRSSEPTVNPRSRRFQDAPSEGSIGIFWVTDDGEVAANAPIPQGIKDAIMGQIKVVFRRKAADEEWLGDIELVHEKTAAVNDDYYMTEGCGAMAIALAEKLGSDKLYVISAKNGKLWGDEFDYEISHVFVVKNGKTYDAKGERSPKEMAAELGIVEFEIKGPWTPGTFQAEFMGMGDDKPLYGGPKMVEETKKCLGKMAFKVEKPLYHVTFKSKIPSILEHGLLNDQEPNWPFENIPARVHLTVGEGVAFWKSMMEEFIKGGVEDELAVVEVDPRGLDFADDEAGTDDAGAAAYWNYFVPPSHIKVVASKTAAASAVEPWQQTQREYLEAQKTGYIQPEAYRAYATSEGIASFIRFEDYPEHLETFTVRGIPVDIRRDRERSQYTKTDENRRASVGDATGSRPGRIHRRRGDGRRDTRPRAPTSGPSCPITSPPEAGCPMTWSNLSSRRTRGTTTWGAYRSNWGSPSRTSSMRITGPRPTATPRYTGSWLRSPGPRGRTSRTRTPITMPCSPLRTGRRMRSGNGSRAGSGNTDTSRRGTSTASRLGGRMTAERSCSPPAPGRKTPRHRAIGGRWGSLPTSLARPACGWWTSSSAAGWAKGCSPSSTSSIPGWRNMSWGR